MSKSEPTTWRFYLMFFLFLTSGSVAIDCFYKLRLPLRTVTALILQNALLPAMIAAALLLLDRVREK